MTRLLACTLASLLLIGGAHADTPPALAKVLEGISPEAAPSAVQPSAIDGLYEVIFGNTVYYFSADGKYMLGGPMVELASRRNLSAAAVEKVEREQLMPLRKAFLKDLKDADTIVFAAAEPKYRVTVFTDIDCGYCRELHRHIDQYNAAGISVRYVAFPRAGLGSESFKKAEAVWCADDRKAALTAAKAGKPTPQKSCDNPVAAQFQAGQKLGVSGTPEYRPWDKNTEPSIYPGVIRDRNLNPHRFEE